MRTAYLLALPVKYSLQIADINLAITGKMGYSYEDKVLIKTFISPKAMELRN